MRVKQRDQSILPAERTCSGLWREPSKLLTMSFKKPEAPSTPCSSLPLTCSSLPLTCSSLPLTCSSLPLTCSSLPLTCSSLPLTQSDLSCLTAPRRHVQWVRSQQVGKVCSGWGSASFRGRRSGRLLLAEAGEYHAKIGIWGVTAGGEMAS